MATKKQYAAMVHVGATKESVDAARSAILEIMRVKEADSPVKVEALKTLSTLCNVNGTTISDCDFRG